MIAAETYKPDSVSLRFASLAQGKPRLKRQIKGRQPFLSVDDIFHLTVPALRPGCSQLPADSGRHPFWTADSEIAAGGITSPASFMRRRDSFHSFFLPFGLEKCSSLWLSRLVNSSFVPGIFQSLDTSPD